MVFQENRLLPWATVLGNLRLTRPDLSLPEAEKALEAFGLAGSAGRPAGELSGGMQRRVTLLRALLSPSPLLLLDEPFTGLDEDTKQQTMEETRRRCQGRSVLLVTHDPTEAAAMRAAWRIDLAEREA